MFKKVLVAEDLENINRGVASVFNELGMPEPVFAQYCDDAYIKVKRAELDGSPFELLISDLSFKQDHREQKYPSGEELIKALKEESPDLKVIIFSVEDRPQKIRKLFDELQIDAYVCKGRKGSEELKNAVVDVYNHKKYISSEVADALTKKNVVEISPYDIRLVKLLSDGFRQEEIGDYLKKKGEYPNSTSTIEKRLNKLKIHFKARNSTHLVSIIKDMGLI
ncbi:response regulator [Leptobacterium flavescens]|uniref:Response regulator n=1 Tax=Leptobacterium flavescens TaxID=472055 RepID=A0A6P0UMZ4_9FLAO|nr:response regulator transcription factor [Leptobacterium flavescens]NER14545.1 response regulator [Leptobacterium flavescens]